MFGFDQNGAFEMRTKKKKRKRDQNASKIEDIQAAFSTLFMQSNIWHKKTVYLEFISFVKNRIL